MEYISILCCISIYLQISKQASIIFLNLTFWVTLHLDRCYPIFSEQLFIWTCSLFIDILRSVLGSHFLNRNLATSKFLVNIDISQRVNIYTVRTLMSLFNNGCISFPSSHLFLFQLSKVFLYSIRVSLTVQIKPQES